MTEMLALPAPYGYPNGLLISITAPRENAKEIAQSCEEFGCPPFLTPKIESSIRHSGRYDCSAGSAVADQFDAIGELLERSGGKITASASGSWEYREWLKREPVSLARLRRVEVAAGRYGWVSSW